jgi:cytochrome c oxidase assembly protein subunit 15
MMVVLGGVTRLTGSGLSIVEWRPIMGALPPLDAAQWQEAFALYQLTPEFQNVNPTMDVEGFKGIFWLEYLHRLLGRAIGLAFIVPFAFFLATGRIARREVPRYLGMFVLGGLQGVLGWYMVKSGLVDLPRVSQYRLTAHLMLAFAIYAYMYWVAADILWRADDGPRHPWYGPTLALLALVVVTIVSGGFVAGLDAGLIHNTFPLMGGRLVPEGLGLLDPAWRNLFENMVTVQFAHRLLALTTLAVVLGYWWRARRAGLPPRLRLGLALLPAVAAVQVGLGIATLLLVVPVPLAATHQAVAVVLFTVVLHLCHGLRGAAP